MKALKLLVLSVIATVVMALTWVVGTMIGNVITQSAPPPPPADAANAGMIFLGVCAFDAILVVILLFATEDYRGKAKHLYLTLFVFGVQHLLPQMETIFFGSDMGISLRQALAILIAGAVSSTATVLLASIVYSKMIGTGVNLLKRPVFAQAKVIVLWMALLIVVVYPLLYLTFGYYVAWQNENLRIYYTSSPDIAPFLQQFSNTLMNGIYAFQILRGMIWIAVTAPVVLLLKGSPLAQYVIVAILCSLLPTSLLFIPNPYMPEDIAMTHFVETSTSNFLWGLAMVAGIKRMLNT